MCIVLWMLDHAIMDLGTLDESMLNWLTYDGISIFYHQRDVEYHLINSSS